MVTEIGGRQAQVLQVDAVHHHLGAHFWIAAAHVGRKIHAQLHVRVRTAHFPNDIALSGLRVQQDAVVAVSFGVQSANCGPNVRLHLFRIQPDAFHLRFGGKPPENGILPQEMPEVDVFGRQAEVVGGVLRQLQVSADAGVPAIGGQAQIGRKPGKAAPDRPGKASRIGQPKTVRPKRSGEHVLHVLP